MGPYTSLQPITCSVAQVRIRSQPPVVNRKDCVNKSSSDLSVLRSSLNFTATTSQQSSKTPAPVELCPATQGRSEEVISSWGPGIQMPCVSVCDCRLWITITPVYPNLDSQLGKKHYFLQEKLKWPKPSDPDISPLFPFNVQRQPVTLFDSTNFILPPCTHWRNPVFLQIPRHSRQTAGT